MLAPDWFGVAAKESSAASMLSLIVDDARRYMRQSAPSRADLARLYLANPGFRATFLYRIGHRFRSSEHRYLAALIERYMRRSCHCAISSAASIGSGFHIAHVGSIVIGSRVSIGAGCSIRQGVTIGGAEGRTSSDGRTQPILGNNVVIGAGAVVTGPIVVGDGAFIGANVVLRESVSPGSRVTPPVPRVV